MAGKRRTPDVNELEAPHDVNAEMSVLGKMLVYPETEIDAARAVLQPEDFFSQPHQVIFRTICKLADEGRSAGRGLPDITIVRAQLEADGNLELVGGAAYLGRLVDFA